MSGRQAGFLVIASEVAVLSAIIGERGCFIFCCDVAVIAQQVRTFCACFIGKSNLSTDPHCFNLAEEDDMIPAGILSNNAGIDKCKRAIKDGRTGGAFVEAGMAEICVAFLGRCSEAARKIFLLVGQDIYGEYTAFTDVGECIAGEINAYQNERWIKRN